ncbi:MAG: RluA family pseudouridine synthase [Clostridia bacterium]|nr:RluA family pseudouridine synthase [Clostridia bacterium]
MSLFTYIVPPEYDGEMLQTFLRRECGLSYRMLVKLKRVPGGMTLDGQPWRSIDRIRAGQTVELRMPEDAVRIEGEAMPLSVAYEDDYLLVVDKPPYLAVHPSAGKPEPTLANGVVAYFEQQGTPLSFRPINRLDRNTSGLLVAAKSPHVAFAMAQKPEKAYYAILLGALTGEGVIDQPIRVKEGSCITREVGEGGKDSLTRWQALATDGEITLARVVIETGRTHQIRVHMAWLGYPLAGDTMYGTDETVMPRHGLHCARTTFIHPITGDRVALKSPIPPDMRQVLETHGLWRDDWDILP